VTEVASAEDALIRMKAEEFDLVFLDWNMEGMSGLDCLRQIRSNPTTEKMFVIMVTTVNEKKNVIQAVRIGIQGYFFKPIMASLLKDKMKEIESKLIHGTPKENNPAGNS
jgi:two-component system chemotaxis response regulator CheY